MRKTFITLTSVAALAFAGAVVPVRAEAHPLALWVVPTIIATGLGGIILGMTMTNANGTPFARETAAVPPENMLEPNCSFERMRIHGVWRRVEVCK